MGDLENPCQDIYAFTKLFMRNECNNNTRFLIESKPGQHDESLIRIQTIKQLAWRINLLEREISVDMHINHKISLPLDRLSV